MDINRDCTTADTKIAIIAAIAKASSIGPNHLIAFVGSMDLSNFARKDPGTSFLRRDCRYEPTRIQTVFLNASYALQECASQGRFRSPG
jgi:hypothetical protein